MLRVPLLCESTKSLNFAQCIPLQSFVDSGSLTTSASKMASLDESYLIASGSSSSAVLPAQQSGSAFVWAQQKSGIHLTHTLHASTLASISVGPSFSIEAPPVSLSNERERWVAVVPGAKKTERQIWTWHATTDKDGSFSSEPPRKSHKVLCHDASQSKSRSVAHKRK